MFDAKSKSQRMKERKNSTEKEIVKNILLLGCHLNVKAKLPDCWNQT